MKAELLPPTEHGEWDRFVDTTPGGHRFLSAAWHRLWDFEAEVRVVRGVDGAIAAGLLSHATRYLARRAVRRPAFTPYNHPLVDPARLPRVSQQVEATETLLNALGTPIVDFVFRHGAPLAVPAFVHAGFESSLAMTYVISAAKRSTWRDELSKKHRYSLRKAEGEAARDGWRVSQETDAGAAWRLLHSTAASRGFRLAVSAAVFERAVGALVASGAGQLWSVVDAGGTIASCALLVRDRELAYYLASATDVRRRPQFLGNYVLLASLIQDTLDRGLGFDFEGSSLPGVEQFFRGFGGEMRTNVRQMRFSPRILGALWSFARSLRARRGGRAPSREREC